MLTAEQIINLIEQQKRAWESSRDSDKSAIDSLKASKQLDGEDKALLSCLSKSYFEKYNRVFALEWVLDLIKADGDISKID